MRKEQDITELPNEKGRGKQYAHPAFGQISVSRISGRRALYGSDFMHDRFVRVAIGPSVLQRDLSHDWYFRSQTVIEVDLSEAQWATFVSSFNVGEGVPCTIARDHNGGVPAFPLRDSGQEYKIETDAKLSECIRLVDEAIAAVDAAGLTKPKRDALLAPLRRAHQHLSCNLPFVAKSFGEHMETRVEKAKVEVEAYISGAINRAGLAALAAKDGITKLLGGM